MHVWHRVFSLDTPEPDPASLCVEMERDGFRVRPFIRGDDAGWFEARIELIDLGSRLLIERYLVGEEKLRGDLNSWSAWVESQPASEEREAILDHIAGTCQFVTLFEDATEEREATLDPALVVCRWLARTTRGIYQIDGQGFFDAAGHLLLPETNAEPIA